MMRWSMVMAMAWASGEGISEADMEMRTGGTVSAAGKTATSLTGVLF